MDRKSLLAQSSNGFMFFDAKYLTFLLLPNSRMAKACMDVIAYDHDDSNIASLNVLKQAKFLPTVLKQLETEPETVIKALTELREICMAKCFLLYLPQCPTRIDTDNYQNIFFSTHFQ